MHGSFNPILQSSPKKLLARSNTAQGPCAFLAFASALKSVCIKDKDVDGVGWCLPCSLLLCSMSGLFWRCNS
jgi:hypothetical protein